MHLAVGEKNNLLGGLSNIVVPRNDYKGSSSSSFFDEFVFNGMGFRKNDEQSWIFFWMHDGDPAMGGSKGRNKHSKIMRDESYWI